MAIQSESSVQQHTYSAIGHQILSLRSGLSNIAEKDAFTLKVVNQPSGDNVTSLLLR